MTYTAPLLIAALVLAGCVSVAPPATTGPIVIEGVQYAVAQRPTGAVEVARMGRPFENWEGAEARRAADRFCGARAKSSYRDRFQGDVWLIVGGCV
jgi:hypothetical protein